LITIYAYSEYVSQSLLIPRGYQRASYKDGEQDMYVIVRDNGEVHGTSLLTLSTREADRLDMEATREEAGTQSRIL
jgi:hypothetical protein